MADTIAAESGSIKVFTLVCVSIVFVNVGDSSSVCIRMNSIVVAALARRGLLGRLSSPIAVNIAGFDSTCIGCVDFMQRADSVYTLETIEVVRVRFSHIGAVLLPTATLYCQEA